MPRPGDQERRGRTQWREDFGATPETGFKAEIKRRITPRRVINGLVRGVPWLIVAAIILEFAQANADHEYAPLLTLPVVLFTIIGLTKIVGWLISEPSRKRRAKRR